MTERMIIFDAVLKMIMVVVTAVLIPAIKEWIDRNADNKELQLVLQMARVAVKSVETDLDGDEGGVKKETAMRRLAQQIESWGLKDFTTSELDHYIETVLREMWTEENY
jgi:LL-H family phage holin